MMKGQLSRQIVRRVLSNLRTFQNDVLPYRAVMAASYQSISSPHREKNFFSMGVKASFAATGQVQQRRWASVVDHSQLPSVTDPAVQKALNHLIAIGWVEIDGKIKDEIKSVLSKTTDAKGKEQLQSAWHSAEATVGNLPEEMRAALKSALTRYMAYLASFSVEETWLKKKVEAELGSELNLVKQRCSGLEPDWGQVSLLGTSGLSGSYIERRR
eukprot:jgi/Mesen1/2378/ME000156S01517